jgi:hypothetical protein
MAGGFSEAMCGMAQKELAHLLATMFKQVFNFQEGSLAISLRVVEWRVLHLGSRSKFSVQRESLT